MTATRRSAALDKALDEAAADSWTVVSMKNDWRSIFPGTDLPLRSQ